jgi:large subunit ribosomal protein L14e
MMDLYLTPVKIRGRKRKQSELAEAKVPSSPVALTPSSTPAKRLRTSKLNRRKKKTVSAMPTLQGLPQELLEMVFLYSMNTALPRSSASLGRKLSSRAVTLEFTMRVFFHTVDHKTNYRDRKKTSDPIVQSDVLSCKFFTWDFFLAYVQKAHDTMIALRGKAWEKTGVEVPGVGHFEGLWPFKFTTIPYLSFAEGFHVPERLLHGPWTHDKASLLYVLVSLNGEIDWEGSMAGEAAKLGIKEAIKEKNEHAVAALSVLLGVPKAIDTSILRYAVVECGCDINILRHLLFNAQILAHETSKDFLSFLDTRLWAWADANGAKGEALKHMLRKADAFDLEFYFEEDSDWTTIVSFPYGGSKFDTRTTLDVVVRELLTNLYRSYGRKITRRIRRGDAGDMDEHVEE